VVSNRKKTELLDELHQKGFKLFSERKGAKKEEEEGEEEEESPSGSVSLSSGYDYLLSMKIWSLTMERVKALTAERDEKRREVDVLTAKTAEDLWLEDLDCLEIALGDFEVSVSTSLSRVHKEGGC
jgi:DNA topoisomerase II